MFDARDDDPYVRVSIRDKAYATHEAALYHS